MIRPFILGSAVLSVIITLVTFQQFTADQRNAGTWGCEMSWMTPSYQEIEWKNAPIKRYRLFWYREQGWDQEETPTGLPVIFVPGNAGSFSQVRSIASSASRQFYGETRGKDELPEGTKKLDFFAVDLNEEFSALHGPTLRQQGEYVSHAIEHIRSLYPGETKPQVILLGHSMGGIVARLAAKSAASGSVNIILTMATPHTIPPAPLDLTAEAIYRELAAYQGPSPLLVSLCGGISDTQVVSDACSLGEEVQSEDGLTVFTSGLPGAWTAVDHQAIVWCHQIRWAVARALLEAANMKDKEDQLRRMKRWLSDDVADRAVDTTSLSKHKIPIIARKMTILVRHPHADLPLMAYCPAGSACRPIKGNMSRIPWLSSQSKLFPFVGEGVHIDEVATAIDVEVVQAGGHIEAEVETVLAYGETSDPVPISGSNWRSDIAARARVPLRLSLNFTSIRTAASLAYRLNYETLDCTGHSPVITAHYTCDNLSEAQVFAGNQRVGYLSNHIVKTPFLPRHCSPGVKLDIIQDQACPVTAISVELAWGASLAKAVMRYRMAVLTWGIGWLSLAGARVLDQGLPLSVLAAYEVELGASWKTIGLMMAACLLQFLVSSVAFAHNLLVGQSNLALSIPFTFLLATWSAGATGFGMLVIETVLRTRVPAATPTDSTKLASKDPGHPRAAHNRFGRLTDLIIIALTVLSAVYVPHQLIALILFALIWRAVLFTSDRSSQQIAIGRIGASLLTFGLPFNIAILPVWGRYVWADWRHPFPSEHNVIWVIPPLFFLFAVQNVRLGHSKTSNRWTKHLIWTLRGLAVVTFALGARFSALVWVGVNGILLLLGLSLCI